MDKPVMILIAHDAKKSEMVRWANEHRPYLEHFTLYATGTTGTRVIEGTGLDVHCLLSGPLGGDAQVGAMIATGRAQAIVFLWDPLTAQPHDVDVRAVIRLAVLYDVPMACNLNTANLLIKGCLPYEELNQQKVSNE